MTTAAWVALNSLNAVWAWFTSVEVNDSYSPLVTASAMPDRDSTGVVATTLAVTFFGKRKGLEWASFPEVIVYRSDQVTETGSPWLVRFHRKALFTSVWRRRKS